jgi:hypothetical protein
VFRRTGARLLKREQFFKIEIARVSERRHLQRLLRDATQETSKIAKFDRNTCAVSVRYRRSFSLAHRLSFPIDLVND